MIWNQLEDELNKIECSEEPTRDDWHAQRLGKLTASRFEDMMKEGRGKDQKFGAACMTYVYEKVAELLTNAPHEVTSKAMEWGSDMEAKAIERYEAETGLSVTPAGFVNWGDYAGGTPDGLVGEDGIIEVKCPFNPANHIETVITNRVPDKHILQIQGNLMVTGRKWCDFISYDPRVQEESLQMFRQRVMRDEEIIKGIQERIELVSQMILKLYTSLKNA